MSWGSETCGVAGGGKGKNKLTIFELADVTIDDGNTTQNVYLVPTIVTDGSVVYCAFVEGRDNTLLLEWQQIMINDGIIKVAIDRTRFDDDRHFRYSVNFHTV